MDISSRNSNAEEDVAQVLNLHPKLELWRLTVGVFIVSYGVTPELQHNVCEQK